MKEKNEELKKVISKLTELQKDLYNAEKELEIAQEKAKKAKTLVQKINKKMNKADSLLDELMIKNFT